MQPKALAHLLEPFGIQPRNHRTGPQTVTKGYYREDLEPIWRRHLEPLKAATPDSGEKTSGTAAVSGEKTRGTAAPAVVKAMKSCL